MKSLKFVAVLSVALICTFSPLRAWAEPVQLPATQPAEQPFIRFVEDGKDGGKLETAIVTYKNAGGVTLHLVSAVHIGETSYYKELNKTFEAYDVLLYELIMPKGARPPAPGAKPQSGVSMFQRFLKNVLNLDFQLDAIDYTRPNFVHADLDAQTFADMQDARGESILGVMFRSMIHEMERESEGKGEPQPIGLVDLLMALRAPDRARQLKILMGRQFDDIEEQMSGLDGPNGSVIITERNKKCVEVLKLQIAEGHENIGIFYGGAHMHDLSQRVEKLGFHQTGVEWRVTWDMTVAAPATQPATQKLLTPAKSE